MSTPQSPDSVALLLQTVQRLQQRGEIDRARSLLRVLAAQHPSDRRVWETLAGIAATDAEKQRALAMLAALNPPTEPPAPPAPPGPAAPTKAPASPTARRSNAPIYLLLMVVVLGLVVLALLRFEILSFNGSLQASLPILPTQEPPTATPPLPGATTAPEVQTPTQPTSENPAPQSTAMLPTDVPAIPTIPLPTATPRPTTVPVLAPGAVIEQGTWKISLLRPDHAMLLNGNIGNLQPGGRFALVLIMVSNGATAPTRLPDDLFVLVDGESNRYRPLPAASTIYLDTYGRGQRGDLSLEDAIPSGGGNVSIPLIFDIPPSARNLMLYAGTAPDGWNFPAQ